MSDIFRFLIDGSDDAGDLQLVRGRGLPAEELVRVHRVMPFGLASHAPEGSHALALAVGGRRDQVAVIGGETAGARPKNQPAGTATLYDASGNVVSMLAGNGIRIRAVAGNAEIEAHGLKVIISPGRIDLGGPGGAAVETTAGPSTKVFAIL
jgi:phage gp45-like